MDVFQKIVDIINGSVYSQGIKVRFPGWMVLGSKEWDETPNEIKAYAYQAVLATGWTKESLIKTVCALYNFIDEHMAEFTINLLNDLVKQYPLEVEERKKEQPKVTLRVRGNL